MKKIVVIFLSVFCLVGCSNNYNFSESKTQAKTENEINLVDKPNYNSRMESWRIIQGEVLKDGSELIHEVKIKYSSTKSLELSVFLNYADNDNVKSIYLKSNMNDSIINIFEDKIATLGNKDYIASNLQFDLHSYRILRITISSEVYWVNFESLIDNQKYPSEIEEIYANHPKSPDLKFNNKGVVVVETGSGEYIQLTPEDSKEIINVYSQINDDMFFENYNQGALTYMENQTLYITVDDRTFLFKPLFNTGTMIDYGIFSFEDNRVYEILSKYVTLIWYDPEKYE